MAGDIAETLRAVETGGGAARDDAEELVLFFAVVGPGSFFGEMALLEQLPRSASAVALEKSEILLLYRAKLDNIIHYHPRIGVQIMVHLSRLLSSRLRRTSDELTGVTQDHGDVSV